MTKPWRSDTHRFKTWRLTIEIYGKGPYKLGQHHWTRNRKCSKTLEMFNDDYNKALEYLKQNIK